MLSEEDQRLLVLYVGGMADAESARRGEALLAESAEAREFADGIRRITAAIGPTPDNMAPLSDEELAPWLELAGERFGQDRAVSALPARPWVLRRSVWFASAIAASLLIAVGVWRFRTWATPPAPTPGFVGRIWQLPEGSFVAKRTVLRQELRGEETIALGLRSAKMELRGATVWLGFGSEFSLSHRGTVLDVRQGHLFFEAPSGERTWRIRLMSNVAEIRSGGLEVSRVGTGSSWSCFKGEAHLRLKSGDALLKAGESIVVNADGAIIVRRCLGSQALPKWVPWTMKSFDVFVGGATGGSSAK